jgi:CDP-diacylglycerol--glycerol-3-phosphate 3-phosphatidyltransferase
MALDQSVAKAAPEMNLSNAITLSRIPLLIFIVLLLYFGGEWGQLVSVPLILLLILLDAVDGIVARQRGEATLLGSVLDIAADRAVELVLWVVFAALGLIPMLIPIFFIIRGTLTDSVREVGYERGQTAHAQMKAGWARWLVAGRPMRAGFGAAKLLAFMTLALVLWLETVGSSWYEPTWWAAQVLSWLALIMSLLRGYPVLAEAFAWGKQE